MTAALLIGTRGDRLTRGCAQWTFRLLRDRAGLTARPGASPPRLPDLRHTFAVNTMLDSYRTHGDPAACAAALSTSLEHDRHNTFGTRNARLAAIRSLYRYASLQHPEHAALIARVLAIPPKRHDRTIITHLTDPEIDALLAAPDTSTWIGRRDRTMLGLAIESGLRVSELTGLTIADTHLAAGPHISCHGKAARHGSPQ